MQMMNQIGTKKESSPGRQNIQQGRVQTTINL